MNVDNMKESYSVYVEEGDECESMKRPNSPNNNNNENILGRNCISQLFPIFLRRLKGIVKKQTDTCVCVGGAVVNLTIEIQNRIS